MSGRIPYWNTKELETDDKGNEKSTKKNEEVV